MKNSIKQQLADTLDKTLVDEMFEAYTEAKRNYYLGGLRLSEVEGGRFSEACFRILEQITTGSFTPIGQQLNTDLLIRNLANIPASQHSESIRLHIPRALRLVYDIRNKRDAAHLADGIDPNFQDATLVVTNIDWILAEFIRVLHNLSTNEAQEIVNSIVTKSIPVIQDFNGFLLVLNPNLRASNHCLALLYQCGDSGASMKELKSWVAPKMRSNLNRTLSTLIEKRLVHHNGENYLITLTGQKEVERLKLFKPIS